MTKKAIDPITLLEHDVPDDTIVKSRHGKYYLLTQEEQDAYDAKNLAWEEAADDRQKEVLRAQRQPLFEEADYKINTLFDAGQDTTAWSTYRQDLRDVTAQADIYNVIWPTKPA